MDKPDLINHPPHYQSGSGLEAIDVIEAFDLDFSLGNAVKYVLRAGRKTGEAPLKDLKKARWYLNRTIERLEAIECAESEELPAEVAAKQNGASGVCSHGAQKATCVYHGCAHHAC